MKQVLQHLGNGDLIVEDIPVPEVQSGHVLIETTCSLISAGTERMVVDFGRASYLEKALQKPDKVKQVLRKVQTDGLMTTVEAVQSRLDQPIPLGYCNVGRVVKVGKDVEGYKVGDRVISNGRHAEMVCMPQNLTARIPEDVTDEQASFTVISSIALQGVRLVEPTIGEYVCVMGLGLIGLIAVQILQANGVRVIGFDYDPERVKMAQQYGIEAVDLSAGADPVKAAEAFTGGQGIDAVLITAATKSHEVMHQAATMCRQRGRIVLTGVVGLNLDRNDFYEKELTFQVSCSYGPGRYDPVYEDQGHDYPLGFVRWTEQRNFEAVLHLMADQKLKTGPLLTERVPLADAKKAYDMLDDKGKIGILLEYPGMSEEERNQKVIHVKAVEPSYDTKPEGQAVVGIIGAGGFTQARVLPGLSDTYARLKWVASRLGVTSAHAAKKFDIENNTSDYKLILQDDEVNAVLITTRHNSHAKFVIEALQAGKHVFVEKPLCLTQDELADIKAVYKDACETYKKQLIVMVGYNRRFSPLTVDMKKQLSTRQSPASVIFTANAGYIPMDHWTQDPHQGGGRILGEACHFIDYLHYLIGEDIVNVRALDQNIPGDNNMHDNAMIQLEFADGSIGQVNYLAGGHKSYPKERCEAFFEGKVMVLDNFRKLEGFGTKGFAKKKLFRQDKGHAAGFAAFVRAVEKGQDSPIDFDSLVNTMDATLQAWDILTSS